MPAEPARAGDEAAVTAPDGIAIHTFALPATFMGVAEGRIPPGRYAIHRHLTLEQYTYVLAGQLRAVTGTSGRPAGETADLSAGDLLLTLPGESLQFINEGTETARVLFICAPPYPTDDADTRLLREHGSAGPDESRDIGRRLHALRAAYAATIDRRLAALPASAPPAVGGQEGA